VGRVIPRLDLTPREGWRRTAVKTLAYRTLMFLITAVVAFAVTGSPVDAFNIGLVTNAVKTLTYAGYERVWARISWGTVAPA